MTFPIGTLMMLPYIPTGTVLLCAENMLNLLYISYSMVITMKYSFVVISFWYCVQSVFGRVFYVDLTNQLVTIISQDPVKLLDSNRQEEHWSDDEMSQLSFTAWTGTKGLIVLTQEFDILGNTVFMHAINW